jgi:MFS transporter, DHA1 family, multidrug resistance protein
MMPAPFTRNLFGQCVQLESRMISKKRLALLTALLSALGPFAIDTYLPSFQMIAAELNASELQVQQTLTVYLIAFGVMNLFHGAISDSVGRKPVILVVLGLFGLASVGASYSDSIQALWMWRVLQGMSGGVGLTVGRAMIRDSFEGEDAQRLMSYSTMMFALAPALAPLVGGWIALGYGWRAVFTFLGLYAWVLALCCFFFLPETLSSSKRHPLEIRPLFSAYAGFFTSKQFWRVSGAQALNFQGFFLYILAAPALILSLLKLTPNDFYWVFIPATLGTLVGAAGSARASGRRSPKAMIRLGYQVMLAASVSGLLVAIGFQQGWHEVFTSFLNVSIKPMPWLVIHLFFYATGMSFAMSALQVKLLDLAPSRRGTISSCHAFVQSCGNSLAAGVLVPLLWFSSVSLAVGSLLLLLGSIILYVAASGRSAQEPSLT